MMCSTLPLVLVALSVALAAPPSLYEDYPVVVPEKRAALVLDRLLIALQKALHDSPPHFERPPDGPRTAALRISDNDMVAAPSKRMDLDWDQLQIAVQNAIHDSAPNYDRLLNGPRASALRFYDDDTSDRLAAIGAEHPDGWLSPEDLRVAPLRTPTRELSDVTGLQRRGQSGGSAGLRGRVLRCYFNAVTCF